MNTYDSGIVELSLDEQLEFQGGDWLERYAGFIYMTAFLGGALAAPELLAISLMAGGSLLLIEMML